MYLYKKKYNSSIDYFKGLLIFSVFLGHLIVGKMGTNFIRYFIYSFHMPLFIGISGYLFNYDSLNNSPKKSIRKLMRKIIVPYILANIIYSGLININFLFDLNLYKFIFNFIKNIVYSSYHLWYIQGYLSYVIISYVLTKKFKTHTIIIFSIILSLSLIHI